MIEIYDKNESFTHIKLNGDIEYGKIIIDTLSCFEEGYRFDPRFRSGLWDGKRHFYDILDNQILQIPKGLVDYIIKDLVKDKKAYTYSPLTNNFELKMSDFESFVSTLNLPFEPYDYQMSAAYKMITKRRLTIRSATSCLDPQSLINVEITKEDLNFLRENFKSSKVNKIITTPTPLTYEEIEFLIHNNKTVKIEDTTGYTKVKSSFVKEEKGCIITLDDNTQIKCAITHNLLSDNEWKTPYQISSGDYLTNKYGQPSKKITSIDYIPKQKWIDFEVSNEYESYIQNGVVHHNSGKSLIAYLFFRFMLYKGYSSMLVVPSINLVDQMFSDFKEYGFNDAEKYIKQIGGDHKGTKDLSEKPIAISTWQSLRNMNAKQFEIFDAIVIDECLAGDSKITMGDGTLKEIKEVKRGDIVLTINERSNILEPKEVEKLHINIPSEEMYEIEVNNNKLQVTGNHKINTKRTWKRVDELELNDEITSIKKIEKPKNTYNLHIKDNHNYFANNINVSNCHTAKGEVLNNIIKQATKAKWKLGMTGTIPRTRVDKLLLLGTLGRALTVITPGALIKRGLATPIAINALYLNYTDRDRDEYNKNNPDYNKEIKFIEQHHYRNIKVSQILSKLAETGNVLGLFVHIAHGEKLLKNCISQRTQEKNIELLHKITPKPIKTAYEQWILDETIKFYMNTPITEEDRKKIIKNACKVAGNTEKAKRFANSIKSLDNINIFFISGAVSGSSREYIRKNLESIHADEINIEFGEININVKKNENIPLQNGIMVKASEVSIDTTISEDWIKNKTSLLKDNFKITKVYKTPGAIVLGNYAVASTGTNFKNLHSIVYTSSLKSYFKIVQSIGRGMRLHKSKDLLNIFDCVDILTSTGRTEKPNYVLKHFYERLAYYLEDEYPVSEKEIYLKGDNKSYEIKLFDEEW